MTKWACSLPCLVLAILASCTAIPTPLDRRAHADILASAQGWQVTVVSAGQFDLTTYAPAQIEQNDTLVVYIEGDGFAWASSSQPSLDPTPIHPVGLELALRHPRGNVAYLARPCQYTLAGPRSCDSVYWRERRFAPEVISASSEALDVLKARAGAQRLTLIGYSGGAAVAALLAARRSDVDRLITIAGNLDHRAWTSYHRIKPLDGSLNPADESQRLTLVTQIHFVGDRDTVIRPEMVEKFVDRFPPDHRPDLRAVPGQEHFCCWVAQWPELIENVLQ